MKRLSFILCFAAGFFVFFPALQHRTQSANLTVVSDVLSNPRLSFYGLTGSTNTVGSTSIVIQTTTGSAPSTDSGQLASPSSATKNVLIGDSVYVLDAVKPNNDGSRFSVTTGLDAGDAGNAQPVIATQSASHSIKFKPASAVANGSFRVLIQATTNTGSSNDGIPDGDGFDLGASAPTVSCPTDVASYYDFVTGTATAQATTINGTKYHVFECRYSGPGQADYDFTANPLIISSLINPAPKTSHAVGTADTYRVIVQNLTGQYGTTHYSTVDQTSIQVGVIESVRVTATVAPQITFVIAGLPSGTTACGGLVTDVTTTATSVPFGEVSISSFTEGAQSLAVSTNAVNGYAVTAQMHDNLGKDGRACADGSFPSDCIPDVSVGGITYGTAGTWSSTSDKGFGYSLGKISGTGNISFTAGNFKQFADLANSEPAQDIITSSTVADAETFNVCYRVVVSSTQPAGDYENNVMYTATASF